MIDYIVYHNPDVMGYSAAEVDDLSIYTKKTPDDVIGARIWLLTGEGTPREYFLRAAFIARTVEGSDRPEFETRIAGKAGTLLYPMPSLKAKPWLGDLKIATGNFGFGFQRINNSTVVSGLAALLASALEDSRR